MQIVCKTLCKTWTARSCPLFITLTLPPPPPPPFFFFFFLLFKKLLRLKINILSSIYPEINFPAESVMKINNLSRPKVPGPPSESNGRPLRSPSLSHDTLFGIRDFEQTNLTYALLVYLYVKGDNRKVVCLNATEGSD